MNEHHDPTTQLALESGDAPPVDIFVATHVPDPRVLASLASALHQAHPLPGYVKRIRATTPAAAGASSIIAAASAVAPGRALLLWPANATGALPKAAAQALPPPSEQFTVQVPSVAPVTRAQAANWSQKFWPVQFRGLASRDLEPTLRPQWDSREKEVLVGHMRAVRRADAITCVDSAALVVFPLATGLPAVHVGPHLEATDSGIHASVQQHASMRAIQSAAGLLRGQPTSPPEQYLLTACDVFLSREPCVMCAMALLHSRVGRVFFDIRDAQSGALGSVCSIHHSPQLNHRFRAFSGFFPE